ncbi:hypothetical protein CERSUDRAFT_93968 [Gelatoporia subvermispora B]|uniref:coproporphyrinogen oxidase n=1 Tax=Ceriporiopsis subvermispora (strain B) TaxID=914234 RepID=M2QN52_CERS8|nr:hypothetical protein CERSUDRAFT_93968 [Gelatoporia subvermispora B]
MAPRAIRDSVEKYFSTLQDRVASAFRDLEPGASLARDSWNRPQGGHGLSIVFTAPATDHLDDIVVSPATVIEKAAVNISVVHSKLSPNAARHMGVTHPAIPKDPPTDLPLYTTGISIIVHPRNPHAPSVHAHYRYVEITEHPEEVSPDSEGTSGTQEAVLAWWFGGSTDLTPTYLYEEDAQHFHGTLRDVCDTHGGSALYTPLKKWCDEYFYIPHREEARGLGGIFFRDLSDASHSRLDTTHDVQTHRPRSQSEVLEFVKALGDAFLPSYLPILGRRMQMPSDERARRWQLLRRGRYVEFNLVCDDGTKFGLTTAGVRVESVLVGLPEMARWEYMNELDLDGEEKNTLDVLRNPREWA